MSKLINSLVSISYDKNRDGKWPLKSAILFGNHKNNTSSPLVYISKPKHVTQEDFDEILDRLQISLQTRIV